MKPLKTILCTVDFSRHTDAIVEMGTRLAAGFKARLILFHSVNFPRDTLHNTDAPERNRKRHHKTRDAEEKMQAIMDGASVSWSTHVAFGEPVETLSGAVSHTGADLIVAASHGLSSVQRMLLGNVIERAVRRIAKPILVLRPSRKDASSTDPDHIRCIVAACGPNPQTDPIPHFAWNMARRFQAHLHLVHALERPIDEDILDPTEGPYTLVQEELRRRIQWRLIDAVSDETRHLSAVHTAVEPGPPGEVLIDYARRQSADLVIVGVRRQGAVRKTIIGSTTEALLRKAPCAVLTLPATQ
ncbi:MAG: universal stress protein [Pseudomonadota bacterium]